MWYWIIMFLLAAGCAGMLAGTFISIKRRKAQSAASRRRGRRRAGASGNADEGQQYDTAGRSVQRRPVQSQAQNQGQQAAGPRKKKRQWKIILEDIDSWQKYSFVFYDVVGIGRAQEGKMYEKFLSLTEDKRISKAHCVIVRRGDQLYLKDEGSRNGTYLNGQRVEEPVLLQKDDIIGVGGIRLEVQRVLRESD